MIFVIVLIFFVGGTQKRCQQENDCRIIVQTKKMEHVSEIPTNNIVTATGQNEENYRIKKKC
jgi:hypothetical protein